MAQTQAEAVAAIKDMLEGKPLVKVAMKSSLKKRLR